MKRRSATVLLGRETMQLTVRFFMLGVADTMTAVAARTTKVLKKYISM